MYVVFWECEANIKKLENFPMIQSERYPFVLLKDSGSAVFTKLLQDSLTRFKAAA